MLSVSQPLPGQSWLLKDAMSPHTNDRVMARALEELLYIKPRMVPRTSSGRVRLDQAAPEQEVFQALLVKCLMSSSKATHPVEHPGRSCLSGIQGYLNAIVSRPDVLEIYTNTACRVASRLMPVLYDGHRVAGIPGLRFLNHSRRRVRLRHLPTGARIDLIDSHVSSWFTVRDMHRTFLQEVRWHDDPDMQRLWELPALAPEEERHADLWAPTPCTPLRSAIMVRAMSLWYKNDIYPDWVPPQHGTDCPGLTWDISEQEPGAAQIGSLLTASAIAIPAAVFHQRSAHDGLLELGDGRIRLSSGTVWDRVTQRTGTRR
ncbi:hypothetical protein ACFWWC_28895 [Streptomyces sp. NPDC058642]|uniref:hypothetical protein n=1 Tax=Streptomyces sp. NPDC058642 TaxID=3346572 RepID=UPI00364D1E85